MSTVAPGRIIVFARVPQLGAVKTRLAIAIGEPAALALHRHLLGRAVEAARQAALISRASIELCVGGDDSHGECARLAEANGASLAFQTGEDLGRRIAHALSRALDEGFRPVLIGSDLPLLDAALLVAAFDALEWHDAVFAPAEDGGYGLVGCRQSIAEAFEAIDWGTPTVMAATRERLREARIDWIELPAVWDVDDAAGLARWRGIAGDACGCS